MKRIAQIKADDSPTDVCGRYPFVSVSSATSAFQRLPFLDVFTNRKNIGWYGENTDQRFDCSAMRILLLIFTVFITMFFSSCKKCKDECVSNKILTKPFIEKYYIFTCGGNTYEYEYVYRRKSQIDSLTDCMFTSPVSFPIDESNFTYILVGRYGYYRNDTLHSVLYKDTCLKVLTYEISTIQRDTNRTSFYPQLVARSLFCAVENIPADYKVEVKYKYVPLP